METTFSKKKKKSVRDNNCTSRRDHVWVRQFIEGIDREQLSRLGCGALVGRSNGTKGWDMVTNHCIDLISNYCPIHGVRDIYFWVNFLLNVVCLDFIILNICCLLSSWAYHCYFLKKILLLKPINPDHFRGCMIHLCTVEEHYFFKKCYCNHLCWWILLVIIILCVADFMNT